MKYFSKKLLWVFAITTILGAGLHFVYALLPNVVTALFSPVNESVWEHLKLLFWPYLAASLLLSRREGKRAERMLSLLIISGAMLGIGYLYHIVFGGESLFFDVALYVILMALGFWLPEALAPYLQGRWGELFLLLVIALGVAVILFTYLPPDSALYADLSGNNTWSTIPY